MKLDIDSAADRWDLYGPVHKGLRHAHALMLSRIGNADFTADTAELLRDLRAHLAMAASHLHHEEQVIHAAIEARCPGAAAALEEQHDHHRVHIAAIDTAIGLIEAGSRTQFAGRRLYRLFAQFVADDLDHMAEEEGDFFPLLCRHFTDAELKEIEHAIVANLEPDMAAAFAEAMLAAANIDERVTLLGGLRQGMPAPAYQNLFRSVVVPSSSGPELERLGALGLAA